MGTQRTESREQRTSGRRARRRRQLSCQSYCSETTKSTPDTEKHCPEVRRTPHSTAERTSPGQQLGACASAAEYVPAWAWLQRACARIHTSAGRVWNILSLKWLICQGGLITACFQDWSALEAQDLAQNSAKKQLLYLLKNF